MTRSTLEDAFAHHLWATLRVIDACRELPPEHLATAVPGTYGSIIDTLRHLVGADASYLWVLTDGEHAEIEEETMDLAGLREAMEANGPAWTAVIAADRDPGEDVVRHRDDGTDSHAPLGIRLAQALHHGTDHRSQVCTGLTALGVEPPAIDVWDYGAESGRVHVTPSAG